MARVLVIDDDVELLKLVSMLLKRSGIESITASSGKEAFEALAAEKVDVVLLDLMLPDINGYEILRKIREEEALDGTPVLILSAKADVESIREGLSLGADGYVTKPYIGSNLAERVLTLISKGRPKQ